MTSHAPAHAPPRDAGDAAWIEAARETLAQSVDRLARRFDIGDPVERLLALRARAADAVIRQAWERCFAHDAGLSLFAVGGYGRGELFPQSDIDLLLLGEPAVQARWREAIARFLALLWDVGLQASHAVRSVAECADAAADQTVLTALIESRPLVAGESVVRALAAAIAPARLWDAHAFFEAKRAEQAARHARYGDTSDNLEPNLKDGPGGLRDVQTLGWMALRAFGVREFAPLVSLGHLGNDEAAALDREWRALSRLRFGLHLVAGRAEERLRFDHQKALAQRLGHEDGGEGGHGGVEAMMQGFYRSAAVVRRIGDRLLQRFEEHFDGDAEPVAIDAGFERRRGYLAARDPEWPRGDMEAVFALFARWAGEEELRGLHNATARALAEALPQLPAYDAATPAARDAFMALLRGPRPVPTLERMARIGVLGRWLPAFAQVSGRMQFDLFHVYTVDQHTLAVLRNIAALAAGGDPRFVLEDGVHETLRRPELLLLAGLFHDVAKGRGGDHSELGADEARAFCGSCALPERDTALVEWLVRKHLLMSVTSQKQDISDPAVIHRFATEVGERERLDYLYLLTCADIAGTSPKLWNAWKERLLSELRLATRLALRRGLENPVDAAERMAETRDAVRGLLAAQGIAAGEAEALFRRFPDYSFLRARPDQIAWQAGALREAGGDDTVVRARLLAAGQQAVEVFVHAPDRDGLFAAIVITLDRMGLAIVQARALDGPGDTIFDSFQVLPVDPRQSPDTAAIASRLATVLAGPLDRVRPSRRAQPRHLRHFRFQPRIAFGDAPDGRGTVLTIVCTDRPGLLADIAHVLRGEHLRVEDARIATFGERAEDVFRVATADGAPLDPPRQAALQDALLARIDGET